MTSFSSMQKYSEKNITEKNEKWAILGSNSWIKGVEEAKQWCEENGHEYEVFWGLPYDKLLESLAQCKGFSIFTFRG